MVTEERFGILEDGREITQYTITNKYGESVGLLNYGAAIHSLNVRKEDGKVGDVVLGAEKAADLTEYTFEGVTIGRCANRIANGRYTWKGKTYQLEQNKGVHFMHGACGNYAHQMFSAQYRKNGNSVIFGFRDTGKGGFDCEAEVQIKFSFNDRHCLSILYEITPAKDTLVCPTNHAYFNLTDKNDIRKHTLRVNACYAAIKDAEGIPHGEIRNVSCTNADFQQFRDIGSAMEQGKEETGKIPFTYDEYYLLRDISRPAAEIYAPDTKRIMRVYTDMPGLILFTPYETKARTGKNGEVYQGYCAVCLETQYIPNAVNCPGFLKPIVLANQTFRSKTSYIFDVIDEKKIMKEQVGVTYEQK